MNLIRNKVSTVKVNKAAELPKIRLRGSLFFYTPRPRFIPKIDRTDWPTIVLIYRGSLYQRKIKPLKLGSANLRNWR